MPQTLPSLYSSELSKVLGVFVSPRSSQLWYPCLQSYDINLNCVPMHGAACLIVSVFELSNRKGLGGITPVVISNVLLYKFLYKETRRYLARRKQDGRSKHKTRGGNEQDESNCPTWFAKPLLTSIFVPVSMIAAPLMGFCVRKATDTNWKWENDIPIDNILVVEICTKLSLFWCHGIF